VPDAAPLFAFEQVRVESANGVRLRDLTATVADDAITVIVGPSGSGKTTLLRLCNRLDVPTSGRVCFRGDDVARLDPLRLRRRVGMVFQRPTLFEGTVRDNLLEADESLDDDTMALALERVDLPRSFLARPRGELSGGEAQRCCLARTLITAPEVLLMDEPTAALDPDRRQGIERLVLRLVDEGTPVLWVTHDLDQARRLGGPTLVLVEGRLATDDEARDYLARRPQEEEHDGD
jgi:putative ABC transport system ATP-binding protein